MAADIHLANWGWGIAHCHLVFLLRVVCVLCLSSIVQLVQSAGEEKSEKQERDEMIMSLLLDQVLPRATALYLAGPLQVRQQQPGGRVWSPAMQAVVSAAGYSEPKPVTTDRKFSCQAWSPALMLC